MLESSKVHAWKNKPGLIFLRGIVERFVKKNLYNIHDAEVIKDTKSLYNHLKKYLDEQGKWIFVIERILILMWA